MNPRYLIFTPIRLISFINIHFILAYQAGTPKKDFVMASNLVVSNLIITERKKITEIAFFKTKKKKLIKDSLKGFAYFSLYITLFDIIKQLFNETLEVIRPS